MSSVSYKSDNLFFIEETVAYVEHVCQDKNTRHYARFAFLFASAAEALKCAQCTVKTLGSIPFAIIRVPCSFLHQEGDTKESIVAYIHDEFPSLSDVCCHAFLAFICFSNIILTPIIGVISPEDFASYHRHLFSRYGVKPKKKKIEEKIKIEIKNDVDFKSLAGIDEIKNKITLEVLEPLNNPEKAKKYGVKIEHILLHGLPGCGKTHLVSALKDAIQNMLGFHKVTYHKISSGTHASTYMHGTAIIVNQVFRQVQLEIQKGLFPIIFIDEIECVLGKREDSSQMSTSQAKNEEVGLYLEWVDKLSGKALIIGATNFPSRIDPALIRPGRMGYHIWVPTPDALAREQILQSLLDKLSSDIKDQDIDVKALAEATNFFAACDLKILVERAAKMAFNQNSLITQQMFILALKDLTPSSTPDKTEEYIFKNRSFFKAKI